MKKALILILVLGTAIEVAWGQQHVVVEERYPDCNLPLTIAGSPFTSTSFDNRIKECKYWSLSYNSSGWAAVSLQLNAAPDNAGVPGAWAIFPGTVTSGVNPNVSLTSASTSFTGYYPWLQVVFAGAAAGAINGRLYGWREPPPVMATILGGAGGGAQAVFWGCNQSALFNLAAAGNTRVIVGTAAKLTYICHISFSTTAGEDVKLVYGTRKVADCDTGPTDLTGLYKTITAAALDFGGSLIVPLGKDLCINQSNGQALGGVVTYAQY